MAHSYVEYGDQIIHIHDFSLSLAIHVLRRVYETESLPATAPETIGPMIAYLSSRTKVVGAGIMNVELTPFLATPAANEMFRRLVDDAVNYLDELGDQIPASVTAKLCGDADAFPIGTPTKHVRAARERIRTLIS